MRRIFPLALLTISLIAAACGGSDSVSTAPTLSPEEAEFGPVMEDAPRASPAETAPPTADDSSQLPDTIPFEEETDRPLFASLPAREEGVCVVLDAFLDILFDPDRSQLFIEENETNDELGALMRSLDDGPFGAEWTRFAQSAFDGDGSADLGAFGPEWILSTDQLAQDQCGYPAITALIAASTPDCFTAGEDDGTESEICIPQPDPR